MPVARERITVLRETIDFGQRRRALLHRRLEFHQVEDLRASIGELESPVAWNRFD